MLLRAFFRLIGDAQDKTYVAACASQVVHRPTVTVQLSIDNAVYTDRLTKYYDIRSSRSTRVLISAESSRRLTWVMKPLWALRFKPIAFRPIAVSDNLNERPSLILRRLSTIPNAMSLLIMLVTEGWLK